MSTMADIGGKEMFRDWKRRLGLDRLSPRERRALAVAAVVVGLFLVVELLVVPFWQARTALQRSLAQRQNELTQLSDLGRQYRELRQARQGAAEGHVRRGSEFSLFAFVEQQAERAGARGQIDFIRPLAAESDGGPNSSAVEVRLQRIGLEPLVRFLGLVESREAAVFVRRLVIQESGGSGLLEANLQVIAGEGSR